MMVSCKFDIIYKVLWSLINIGLMGRCSPFIICVKSELQMVKKKDYDIFKNDKIIVIYFPHISIKYIEVIISHELSMQPKLFDRHLPVSYFIKLSVWSISHKINFISSSGC